MPDTMQELFERAESVGMFQELALSESAGDLVRTAKALPLFARLRAVANADAAQAQAVVARIGAILQRDAAASHRHRFDHAIAFYLLVLSESNARCLSAALECVLRSGVRNLWFTIMLLPLLQARGPKAGDFENAVRTRPSAGWVHSTEG